MRLFWPFWICFLFFLPSSFGAFSSVDFRKVIQKYVQNSGVKMNFEKKTYLHLLKKTKVSRGEILISKGSIVLKIEDSLKTRVLSDRNHLWYITSPLGEQKQIVKVDLKDVASKNKVFLSFLFYPDLFFQNFHFVSTRRKGRTWVLEFKPVSSDSDIKSFAVKVDGRLILKAWLKWKSLGNKAEYTFFHIRFNQEISPDNFQVNEKI